MAETVEQRPSVLAQSTNYCAHQRTTAAILDGRYAEEVNVIAAPVEVYHPAFAGFVEEAFDEHVRLPEDVVTATARCMAATSQIVTPEGQRSSVTLQLLSELLSMELVPRSSKKRTSPDHAVLCDGIFTPSGTAMLAIVEEKAELGSSGEGSVQGSFSYREHWLQQEVSIR